MSFLAPIFLAGAAAIALPILFHLIRRSSREKVVFSSLMFLDPSPPRLTKRSRLEHWVLLALRAAVIALLALAFARPFLPKAMPASPTPAERRWIAILVDSSASMRREDLWAQAQNKVMGLVRSVSLEDSVAVYTFDQRLRTLLSFAEAGQIPAKERLSAVEARLGGVTPGWAGTHLGDALLNATEQLLENLNADAQDQGNSGLQLVVISDFQSGARLDGLQGFEWPKKLDIRLETVTAKEKFNASLQVLDDSQGAFLAATNANLRARVFNAAEARGEQFEVFWNGAAGLAGEKLSVYVPPGQSRIVTVPPKPAEASSLKLGGDAVDLDNTVYLVQAAVRPIRVVYWGQESAADSGAMRYYIHRAFEQTNLSTRVLAASNAIPAEAAGAGLLVLDQPAEPGIEFARKMLEEGRSVILPLSTAADANALSELLGGVLVQAREATVRNYALLSRISFQDPLLAPFADARFSDFTKIHFWKYRALNLANVTNAVVLAAFDTGDPALVSIPAGKGRLIVLTSTWKPSDSQLALSTKFVPLLFGILEQSANLGSARHRFAVGESVRLPGTNVVTMPDGSTAAVTEPMFTQTEEPGIYTAGNYQFSVNLDPAESRLAPISREDLIAIGVPVGREASAVDPAGAEKRQRHLLATETESRQKLWRWFVLLTVGVLLVETWLAGRLSRTMAPQAA